MFFLRISLQSMSVLTHTSAGRGRAYYMDTRFNLKICDFKNHFSQPRWSWQPHVYQYDRPSEQGGIMPETNLVQAFQVFPSPGWDFRVQPREGSHGLLQQKCQTQIVFCSIPSEHPSLQGWTTILFNRDQSSYHVQGTPISVFANQVKVYRLRGTILQNLRSVAHTFLFFL